MKILVAEDDITSRKILETILSKWGYKVFAVKDGHEAWEVMQSAESPRLCLVDWMMPGVDGIELCRRMRCLETSVPPYVVLLTARSDKKEIVEGLRSGADDYITKPFDNEELRARIEVGKRVVELQRELLYQEKLRGVLEMAGAICHEFNQPLQVICAQTELLAMNPEFGNPLKEKIAVIRRQTERLVNLTRKVMNITSYEAKDYPGGTKIVDLDRAAG